MSLCGFLYFLFLKQWVKTTRRCINEQINARSFIVGEIQNVDVHKFD